jgi:anthranilate synthase/aminodeoxychorismate synthase-like glutamine amidotransferase
MTILIIDNYDSFVFNLARYVHNLGYKTDVARNDAITLADIQALNPSHLILSPGPCTPNEAGICLELISRFKGHIPILGICLGHQAIGQALGGRVIRAIKPLHGQASLIYHNKNGLFESLEQPLEAGRYHSLVVARENFPLSLRIDAWSAENEIMALSSQKDALYGLQFHPESILTPTGSMMLQNFILQSSAASGFFCNK